MLERSTKVSKGDIVYIYQDRDKTRSRNRYIVDKTTGNKSYLKKFVGCQLRSKVYEVANSDIIKVIPHIFPRVVSNSDDSDYLDSQEDGNASNSEEDSDSTSSTDGDIEDEGELDSGGATHTSEEESDSTADNEETENEDSPAELQPAVEERDEDSPAEFLDAEDVELVTPPIEVGPRRSGRDRKEPNKYQAYYTGQRLNDAVPDDV